MKTALFVDFDNVFSGLKKISSLCAERFARHPSRWLRWLTEDLERPRPIESMLGAEGFRRVLVRRCYLNPVLFSQYRRPFHEAGFEIVDCPPMTATGKTSTDIHMVLDTVDALQDSTRFDEFVMLSADADFSPVLRRLRRHDRRTVVFAAGAMSESYKASADLVIDIPTFIRDGLGVVEAEQDDAQPQEAAARAKPIPEDTSLRKRIAELVRRKVNGNVGPLPLATVAQCILGDVPGARESNWASAGSFGGLMRQMDISGVVVDFAGDVAYAEPRSHRVGGNSVVAQIESSPEAAPSAPVSTQSAIEGVALDKAASDLVKEIVGQAHRPVHLSMIGSQLRSKFSALASSWNGSATLASFLSRLDLAPLRREALDDGSTYVLFDPARHSVASTAVKDPAVAAVLRAAEFPLMKPEDLNLVVRYLMPQLGSDTPFEIATVARGIQENIAIQHNKVPVGRIAAVIRALIFGGLDTADKPTDLEALIATTMGVLLAAWSRETQAAVDDDVRDRLLAWFAGVESVEGVPSGQDSVRVPA